MATKKTSKLVADCDICGAQATDPKDWLAVTFVARPLGVKLEDAIGDIFGATFIDFDTCSGCARSVGIVKEDGGRRRLSVRAAFEALKRRLPWT